MVNNLYYKSFTGRPRYLSLVKKLLETNANAQSVSNFALANVLVFVRLADFSTFIWLISTKLRNRQLEFFTDVRNSRPTCFTTTGHLTTHMFQICYMEDITLSIFRPKQ